MVTDFAFQETLWAVLVALSRTLASSSWQSKSKHILLWCDTDHFLGLYLKVRHTNTRSFPFGLSLSPCMFTKIAEAALPHFSSFLMTGSF